MSLIHPPVSHPNVTQRLTPRAWPCASLFGFLAAFRVGRACTAWREREIARPPAAPGCSGASRHGHALVSTDASPRHPLVADSTFRAASACGHGHIAHGLNSAQCAAFYPYLHFFGVHHVPGGQIHSVVILELHNMRGHGMESKTETKAQGQGQRKRKTWTHTRDARTLVSR